MNICPLWEEELVVFVLRTVSVVWVLCATAAILCFVETRKEILEASFMVFVFLIFPPHCSVDCEDVL